MTEGSSNRVCRLLGIDIPILQAPMTYIAGAVLAAAVSNAGALGMIETASEEGRRDLQKVRRLTDRPVGANVALIMMRDPAVIDVLAEAGVRTVTTSAGDPALFTDRLHAVGITVLHAVGTLRGAMKAVDAGVDGLIVDGIEGGGFKNRHGASTMVLLPLIAARVDLPLIASGRHLRRAVDGGGARAGSGRCADGYPHACLRGGAGPRQLQECHRPGRRHRDDLVVESGVSDHAGLAIRPNGEPG